MNTILFLPFLQVLD